MPALAAAAGLRRCRLCAETGLKTSEANSEVRPINRPEINHARLRWFVIIDPEVLISPRVKDLATYAQSG